MWKYRCSRFVERKKKQVKCKLLAFLNATGTHQSIETIRWLTMKS